MTRLVSLLLIALQPADLVLRDQVDRIEVNHIHDGQGDHSFSQVILWQWGEVRAWRRLEACGRPIRTRAGYRLRWNDCGTLRQIDADTAIETWTQYDPEVEDRQRVRPDQRWPLAPECRTHAPPRKNPG